MKGGKLDNKELREAGLKVTLPRLKILQVLESANPHHMSAEEVHKRLLDSGDDVGLATVYRVLTQFEQAGLVRRHNCEGGHSVLESNSGEHHDHMVCVKCNKVFEFIDFAIEQRQHQVAKDAGFRMTDHSLTIYGICSHCDSRAVS